MILASIQSFAAKRSLIWSAHAAARIQERGICRQDVINCIMQGEIIEDYPTDYPNPSCLIYGPAMDGHIIHVVAGCDQEKAYIITAYVPNQTKFEADLKTRGG